ncbi:MAG: CRTAC1 family protein [Fuerstiella sp.]
MSSTNILTTLIGLGVILCFGCGHETTQTPNLTAEQGIGDATEVKTVRPAAAIEDSDSNIKQPLASTTNESEIELDSIQFKQAAEAIKVDHTYQTGATGQLLMMESIGGGVAWFDADRDGLLDLFCVQGGDGTARDLSVNPSDQLFRRLSSGINEVVTDVAGISEGAYGQGVTVGDFDNDGFEDIYVTNLGSNRLLHNCGDGTFSQVPQSTVTQSERWSSSAAWADTDLDGDLDLYVCNYLKYDPFNPLPCEKNGAPALCHPRQIEAWPDEFFENQGDGNFISVANERGLAGSGNKALGVVVTDLSGDGWPDIYVANDTTSNFYFLNNKDGLFTESSLQLGGGLNAAGSMQASMGVAAGDYDRSGTTDLLLTHFTGESNTLYQNLQGFGLHDVSGKTGLFSISNSKLGFGIAMCDFDLNGQMDLVVANGHIDSTNADGDGFKQHAQLLTYNGRQWIDISDSASSYFAEKHVGRGVAVGDYDQDGDQDLAIAHQNEALEILENTSDRGNWLKLVFLTTTTNRSGIGISASVRIGSEVWYSTICGGTSFSASHEHALFFGSGQANEDATVTVTWPNGVTTVLKDIVLNQTLSVREP